jgi:hypothetical protein
MPEGWPNSADRVKVFHNAWSQPRVGLGATFAALTALRACPPTAPTGIHSVILFAQALA